MSEVKVIFFTALKQAIIDEVVSYVTNGYDLTVLDRESTKEQQIEAVKDADFLLCYGMDPSDEVVRAAEKCRLMQLLAAGYDRVNLKRAYSMASKLSALESRESKIAPEHIVVVPREDDPPVKVSAELARTSSAEGSDYLTPDSAKNTVALHSFSQFRDSHVASIGAPPTEDVILLNFALNRTGVVNCTSLVERNAKLAAQYLKYFASPTKVCTHWPHIKAKILSQAEGQH